MQQGELIQIGGQSLGQRQDCGEDHAGGAHHGGADQHRLRRRLERIAGAIVLFQVLLGFIEIRNEAEFLLDVFFDAGQRFDGRKLVHRLRVVGYRAVAVHGDRHRSHAEESEGHQAEGEDCRSQHHGRGERRAHQVADAHQGQHGHAEPISAKVTCHKPR